VVAGEDAGSKLDRARELGVPIIDEAELRRLLRAASGPNRRPMFAIIGGSGLVKLSALEAPRRRVMRTPYGEPSGALTFGLLAGSEVVFLARHGYGHTIAPHEINYRANTWALKELDVEGVFALASAGGIRDDLVPGPSWFRTRSSITPTAAIDLFRGFGYSGNACGLYPAVLRQNCASAC